MSVIDPVKIKAAVDSILSDPAKKAEFLSSVKRLSRAINDFGISVKEANFSFEDARRIFKNAESGHTIGEMALRAAKAQVGPARPQVGPARPQVAPRWTRLARLRGYPWGGPPAPRWANHQVTLKQSAPPVR